VTDSKRKEVTARIDEDLFEELREKLHERRTTQQNAVVQGLTMWLRSGEAELPTGLASVPVSPANRAIVAYLAGLFEHKGTTGKPRSACCAFIPPPPRPLSRSATPRSSFPVPSTRCPISSACTAPV
jgi:hypothetical protein